jgi:hypothetical protein
MGACLQPVESPELEHLTPQDLTRLPREDYLGELAVADARTMQDQTVMFVDLNEFNQAGGSYFPVGSAGGGANRGESVDFKYGLLRVC